MPMILLAVDQDALAKVKQAANEHGVNFDSLLSRQFNEFLIEKQYAPAPVVYSVKSDAQSVDSRDDLIAKILDTAAKIEGPFTFSDLVPLVPELAEMPKQETTTYASLFARRFHEHASGIVKLGKNSSKATEYEVKGDAA
jgi:hypothetical protein